MTPHDPGDGDPGDRGDPVDRVDPGQPEPVELSAGEPHHHVDATRTKVFDPALRHHGGAFVHGEPAFRKASAAADYYAARTALLDAAQLGIARSPARDEVVLRGSACLAAWFGDRARHPKDLDVVLRAPEVTPDDPRGRALLTALQTDVSRALREADPSLPAGPVVTDRIWTYERAEGRRLLFPWHHTEARPDFIQIDVVYCEPMFTEPERREVQQGGHVWFASRAEQLAWKLLWLVTDGYPQGKDLYDAVLLAERTLLSRRLLCEVFESKAQPWEPRFDDAAFVRDLAVDWPNFALDYPDLAVDTGAAWGDRLARTLQLVA